MIVYELHYIVLLHTVFAKVLAIQGPAEAGLIRGLRPASERRRYFLTTSLVGWAQT